MDASRYLRNHGWRGQGHSLDHSGRGIKKPLLISKKVDALGLGLNKHAAVSDQWWLRALDQGLKNLESGSESKLNQVQKFGHRRSGLYDRFVRGAPIPGSIGKPVLSPSGDTVLSHQACAISAAVGQKDQLSSDNSSLPTPQDDEKSSSPRSNSHALKAMDLKAKEGRKRKRRDDDDGKVSRQKLELAPLADTQGDEQSFWQGGSQLSETKRQKYASRAAEKGISVEDYILRRQQRKEGRAAPTASGLAQAQINDSSATALQTAVIAEIPPTFSATGNIAPGDIHMTDSEPLVVEVARDAPFTSEAYPGATEFADQAMRAILHNRTITIKTNDGREPFSWQAGTPVPLDTRIWEGAKVNLLPKVFRQARRDWMKNRREVRKAERGARTVPRGKSRADKKIQKLESLAVDILKQSRHHQTGDSSTETGGAMSLKGYEGVGVPVIRVKGTSGSFSNEEMARARAAARRVMRQSKKEAKKEAKKGRKQEAGKGSRSGKPSKRPPNARKAKYDKATRAR